MLVKVQFENTTRMNSAKSIFVYLCLIVLSSVVTANPIHNEENELLAPQNQYPRRSYMKIQNNVVLNGNKQTFEEAMTEMDEILHREDTPCAMYDPPAPDFLVGGRRISEAKCLENIWNVKKDEDMDRRVKICRAEYTDFVGIIGGRTAKPGEFPHMGAIGWKAKKGDWAFLCGSSLISDKFVLTAAHCDYAEDNDNVVNPVPKIVRFGVENIAKLEKNPDHEAVDIRILHFIKHPSYKPPPYKTFDIALVELAQRVTFNEFIQPICLMNQEVNKAIVTGWGVVDSANMLSVETAEELHCAEVDIVPRKKCNCMLKEKRDEKHWSKVYKSQICATKINGRADVCGGDSGGPLQAKLNVNTKKSIYNAVGVTSMGFVCGSYKFPSVYTKISSFIDWIEKVVWEVKSAAPKYEEEEEDDNEVSSCREGKGGRDLKPEEEGVKIHRSEEFDQGHLFWLDKTGGKWAYINKKLLEKA